MDASVRFTVTRGLRVSVSESECVAAGMRGSISPGLRHVSDLKGGKGGDLPRCDDDQAEATLW